MVGCDAGVLTSRAIRKPGLGLPSRPSGRPLFVAEVIVVLAFHARCLPDYRGEKWVTSEGAVLHID